MMNLADFSTLNEVERYPLNGIAGVLKLQEFCSVKFNVMLLVWLYQNKIIKNEARKFNHK